MKALTTLSLLPVMAALLLGCGKDDGTAVSEGPVLSISHTALEYGAVDFGLTAGQQITVANIGDETLMIDSASVTAPWRLDTEVPASFEEGESLGVTIGFLAEERGDLEGTFTIQTNDPASPELVIPLTATVSSPPVVTVSLEPEGDIYTDTTLEAVIEVSEGDASNLEIDYSWLVDDFVIDQVENPTFPGTAHFDKHQTVKVIVTPRVGGILLDSSNASVTVLNSPPVAPVIEIYNLPRYPGSNIYCKMNEEASDPDPEDTTILSYEFRWIRDGMGYSDEVLTTEYPGDTIPTDLTLAGERWDCKVIVTDSEGLTAEVQSTVYVNDL